MVYKLFIKALGFVGAFAALNCPPDLYAYLSGAAPLKVSDRYLWDNWVVRDADTGVFYRYALSSPRTKNRDDRHALAEIHLFTSLDGKNWLDKGTIRKGWSGSTIIRRVKGKKQFVLAYTGVDSKNQQAIRLGFSENGKDFTDYSDPVLPPTPHPDYYLGSEDGLVMAWRDPYLMETPEGEVHMYFAAKTRVGGKILPAVGHAVSSDPSLKNWTLRSPIVLKGDMNQVEVPNVVKRGNEYIMLVSTRYKEGDAQPEADARSELRVYRSASPDGGFEPADGKSGILSSEVYGANLVRGFTHEKGGLLSGFIPVGSAQELQATPLIPFYFDDKGVPKVTVP